MLSKLIKKNINSLIFLFIFFIIFSPHVSIFGFIFKTVYLFVVIPSIIGFIKYFQSKNLPQFISFTFYFLLFSLFYNFIFYSIHGFVDSSWLKQVLMGFIEFFAAFLIGCTYVKFYGNEALKKVIVHLFYVGVTHSILMLIIFISPTFRDVFYNFIILSELAFNSTFRLDNQTRFSGLLNTGFGSLSVLNAIMFLMGLYSYLVINKISLFKFIFGSMLLLVSSVLSGRLGIVVMLISLLFLLILPSFKISIFKRKINFILLLLPLIFIFVTLLNVYFPDKAQFAFETYFKYIETGRFDNSTESILSEKLNPDLSFFETFLGTGLYNIDYADSGYIMMINGGGILGALVSYSFFLSLFVLKEFSIKSIDKYNYLLIILVFIIIFINYKNLYFFGYNDVFQIYFIITITAALLESKKINSYN